MNVLDIYTGHDCIMRAPRRRFGNPYLACHGTPTAGEEAAAVVGYVSS